MTERSSKDLSREARSFRVAASQLAWHGDGLVIDVDEISTPFRRRLIGRIRLTPQVLNERHFALDPGERHFWQPVAPVADIEVEFERPAMHWRGHGYLDSNWGSRMLELDFDTWDWSRSASGCATRVHYVANHIGGGTASLGLWFDGDGSTSEIEVPAEQALPVTGWRVGRFARHPVGLEVVRDFEDTPFYSRSLLEDPADPGRYVVHESLDMRRFRSRWVQFLLPFRMPRRP